MLTRKNVQNNLFYAKNSYFQPEILHDMSWEYKISGSKYLINKVSSFSGMIERPQNHEDLTPKNHHCLYNGAVLGTQLCVCVRFWVAKNYPIVQAGVVFGGQTWNESFR